MASTYWAELYFRSLKRIKVLTLLTKYLLQYRRISIPHVGTFELQQRPSQFNVVDKLMLPPSFVLNWNNSDTLSEHQLAYLSAVAQSDKQKMQEELEVFGKKFKSKIQTSSFNWNGIATIKADNGSIAIENDLLQIEGWQAVPAHKIMREHADHNMLVGDEQTTSQQMTSRLGKRRTKKSYAVLIGWIVLVLALLAIVFLLYKEGFNPLSSGLKMKVAE